jgi:hypothetical protein
MTIMDMYPACKKCGSTGRKVYQVGVVLDENRAKEHGSSISIYRCYCAFCDECLEKSKKKHMDHVYVPLTGTGSMPVPSPYLDELHVLYGEITRSCHDENANLRGVIDARKPVSGVFGDVYHDALRQFHAKIVSEYTGEKKSDKDRMFGIAIDAMTPVLVLYHGWLVKTYHGA